jgi:uncharacterized protein (TIGR03118 family)
MCNEMKHGISKKAVMVWLLVGMVCSFEANGQYQQVNLVSNGTVAGTNTDSNLKNPWGLDYAPTGPFWIGDNGTGVSTLYNGSGTPQALVVTIPSPQGPTVMGVPTGVVFNGSADFMNDRFLFATEDGAIAGWGAASGTNALLRADNSASSAVYKGLAIGTSAAGQTLYAANFHGGTIDVFDNNFSSTTVAGGFVDPTLPAGYAPFNIFNSGSRLLVSYALQDAAHHDDVPGPGLGFVDAFDMNGNLLGRLITQGALNSPWGMAIAPPDFGVFSNTLLVGNFGDGTINAFDPVSGALLGTVSDMSNNPIIIDGLWGLKFGNGGNGGAANQLFFTAGINAEADGLFGRIDVVPEPAMLTLMALGAMGLIRKRR